MPAHYVRIPVREMEWDLSDPTNPVAQETMHSFVVAEEPLPTLHAKLPILWLKKRAGGDSDEMKKLIAKIEIDEIQLYFDSTQRIEAPPSILRRIEAAENARLSKLAAGTPAKPASKP
jgi:hypothetical protein